MKEKFKPYQPSTQEIKKAEEMMTPEEKEMSEKREELMNTPLPGVEGWTVGDLWNELEKYKDTGTPEELLTEFKQPKNEQKQGEENDEPDYRKNIENKEWYKHISCEGYAMDSWKKYFDDDFVEQIKSRAPKPTSAVDEPILIGPITGTLKSRYNNMLGSQMIGVIVYYPTAEGKYTVDQKWHHQTCVGVMAFLKEPIEEKDYKKININELEWVEGYQKWGVSI